MAFFNIEQHGLPPVPHYPRHHIEKKLGGDNHPDAQVGKFADGAFGVDAFVAVKLDDLLFDGGLAGGFVGRLGRGLRGGLRVFRLPLGLGWHGVFSLAFLVVLFGF